MHFWSWFVFAQTADLTQDRTVPEKASSLHNSIDHNLRCQLFLWHRKKTYTHEPELILNLFKLALSPAQVFTPCISVHLYLLQNRKIYDRAKTLCTLKFLNGLGSLFHCSVWTHGQTEHNKTQNREQVSDGEPLWIPQRYNVTNRAIEWLSTWEIKRSLTNKDIHVPIKGIGPSDRNWTCLEVFSYKQLPDHNVRPDCSITVRPTGVISSA